VPDRPLEEALATFLAWAAPARHHRRSMIWVMIVGIAGSQFSYLVLARARFNPAASWSH
jgi:hypothetical protein